MRRRSRLATLAAVVGLAVAVTSTTAAAQSSEDCWSYIGFAVPQPSDISVVAVEVISSMPPGLTGGETVTLTWPDGGTDTVTVGAGTPPVRVEHRWDLARMARLPSHVAIVARKSGSTSSNGGRSSTTCHPGLAFGTTELIAANPVADGALDPDGDVAPPEPPPVDDDVETRVPDVVGEVPEDADRAIGAADLAVGTVTRVDRHLLGEVCVVVRQAPLAGRVVQRGARVDYALGTMSPLLRQRLEGLRTLADADVDWEAVGDDALRRWLEQTLPVAVVEQLLDRNLRDVHLDQTSLSRMFRAAAATAAEERLGEEIVGLYRGLGAAVDVNAAFAAFDLTLDYGLAYGNEALAAASVARAHRHIGRVAQRMWDDVRQRCATIGAAS